MKRCYIITLVLIMLFAFAPFPSSLLGSVIATSAGCTLNEAGSHSCIIHGHDYGATLYTMGMGLWMIIFTFPIAEIAFILWVAVLTIHLLVRRWRRFRDRRVT